MKNKYLPGEYYQLPETKEYYCCMCNKRALFVAPETNETLCYKCASNNDEARVKK